MPRGLSRRQGGSCFSRFRVFDGGSRRTRGPKGMRVLCIVSSCPSACETLSRNTPRLPRTIPASAPRLNCLGWELFLLTPELGKAVGWSVEGVSATSSGF